MYFYCVYAGASYNGESPQMPFIFAVSDFRVVFKGVKLQKIFGLAALRRLKKRVLRDFIHNTLTISPPHHLTTTTSYLTISPQQHHTTFVTIRLKPHLNIVCSDY